MRVFHIDEPYLFFGNNSKCVDPQVGLLNFGPYGGRGISNEKSISIRAGIIGTTKSINSTIDWLNRLKYRIAAEEKYDTEYKGIDFPGLNRDSPLGFEIVIDSNCIEKISREFIRSLKKLHRKQRILNSVQLYCDKIDNFKEAHPRPDIIFLPIDDELLSLCKELGRKTDKIVFQRREFGDPDTSTAPMFDFHNYIKAHAALSNFVTQFIGPKTLIFSETKQNPSIIGWNIAVGVYYKATGIPWKIADIDDNTCYVGISYYNEIHGKIKNLRASFAQVYMRTGESQVIRGEPFAWDNKSRGRTIHLDSNQMCELISKTIEVFETQRGRKPSRLVIHKTTHFSGEEIQGCLNASKDIDELDIVQVSEYTNFNAFHLKMDYPVVRGTVFTEGMDAIVFTSGYVPALATYPGPEVPKPIVCRCQRNDTSIDLICKDIMHLTKLDWNSSTFYTKNPVTISVSKKVGDVLSEIKDKDKTPPSSYRFYM